MDADALKKQIREVERLRSQKRVWQLSITASLFLVAIACLLTLRTAVSDLLHEGPTQQVFVTDLSTRLNQNVMPAVQQLGTQALQEINFAAEVQKLNRRTPELAQASLQQMKLLSANLPKRGQKVWKATFETALKAREGKLRAMFPEITEEQVSNVLTNLTEAAQVQVVDINDTLFSRHQKALNDIVENITRIEDTEKTSGQQEPATWEMGLMIFDIAREDLRALEPKANSTAKPKAKGKGTTK